MVNLKKRTEKFDAVSFAPDAKVPFRDKLCFGFTGMATNGPWVIFGYYLTYFYTDVLGMKGTMAAAIMMFARVFDAFTDLMIGWCIDRFNLKWGKYRSWVRFSIPLLFVLFILCFTGLPDSTSTGQLIIAWIGYGTYGAIGSTLCFIPMNCMVTNAARNQEERASIAGWKGIIKNVSKLIVIAAFLPIVHFFGGDNEKLGFFWAAVLFSIIYVIPIIWVYIAGEKYELNADGSYREHLRDLKVEHGEKVSLKTQFVDLLKNRPAMITVVSTFLLYILDGVRSGTTVYLYNNYFEQPELSSIALFFNCGIAIIGALCIKYLIKLFRDSNRAYIITMFGSAAMYLIWYIIIVAVGRERAGQLMGLGQPLFILYALCGFLQGAHLVFPDVVLPMAVDYGLWKYRRNQAGFVFACYGFCLTIGGAIGSGFLGIMLDKIGYSADVALAEPVLKNLLIVGVLVPVILTVVQAVIQCFVGISDKKHAQYVKEIAERSGEN